MEKLHKSAKTRLEADCVSDHELLIAKFRLKLKKVGKSTRPFRYDLNQILYDYTLEVRNRVKGLDLTRVPEELWTQVRDTVQEAVIKTIPKKKKCKKAKWFSEEALQIVEKRSERQRRKDISIWMQSSKEKQGEENLPKWTMQGNRGKQQNGKDYRDLFKKIRDTKRTFHAQMGTKRTQTVWT